MARDKRAWVYGSQSVLSPLIKGLQCFTADVMFHSDKDHRISLKQCANAILAQDAMPLLDGLVETLNRLSAMADD